ncbi:MAG: response regulator, partial [Cyclobacteriaceae bacterium]|nr:response regulator [Cyclobacteriaceae bacterium]
SNAIKFSQKRGTINVGIRLINETDDYYEFRVAVKDSGIGIHPKDQEKLFKIFSQLDSSKRKLFAGTGLGLAISKELVKSMNGEIGVVSTPGLGSTFWFTFQAGKVTEIPVKEKTEEFPLKKEFILRQPRVLLVDDNEINRKVASQILAKSGCQVISAFSGKQAIDLISKQRFDLVFMDIQMPEMDGIETTKKIRELELEYVPPIIAMTAYSMEEDRERFLRQGMDDYLAKPIKSNLIIDKVKQYTRFEPREVDTKVFEEQAEALIINQNTLNQLYKYGGKELIVNVLHEFNNEAIQQVKQSLRFYNKKEFEKMQRELHTLKGNAGTLGIERLSKQAAVVEKKIKENNFDKLKPDLSKLKKSLKEFQDSYKNIIKDE